MKPNKAVPDNATICWECENAIPKTKGGRNGGEHTRGCEWSILGQCVPGWKAKKTRVRLGFKSDGSERTMDSFCVKKCPKFVRG